MQDRFLIRLFDPVQNKMMYDFPRIYTVMKYCAEGDKTIEREKFKFLQCTGLKDKNGKLIFEGDIIKINDKSIAYIEFQRGIFGCQFDKKAKIVPRFLGVGAYESYELEVIGNIYETPELLEDK